MAGDGKVSGLWGGVVFDGRGWHGHFAGVLEWVGFWWDFLHGFLNVGAIFEWVLAGGEF